MLALDIEQMGRLQRLLTLHKLHSVYNWVQVYNQANSLPYHNLYHTQCMVLNCAEGARVLGLSEEDTKALLMAAFFHDFNHSGGELPDDQNIARAVAAFKSAYAKLKIPEAMVEKVIQTIEATQYPYVREAANELEKIIRDADILQTIESCWFEHLYMGMRKEMSVRQGPISLEQFCDIQDTFTTNVEFQSLWGQGQKALFREVALARLALARSVALVAKSQKLSLGHAYGKVIGQGITNRDLIRYPHVEAA